MVSRKVLDERGVFTCDMDDVRQQLDEIDGMLTLLSTHPETTHSTEMLLALQGVARSLTALRRDVTQIDEVLRERGAIVDAHEYLHDERRPREHSAGWHLDQEVQ